RVVVSRDRPRLRDSRSDRPHESRPGDDERARSASAHGRQAAVRGHRDPGALRGPPHAQPGGGAGGGVRVMHGRVPLYGRLPEIYRIKDEEQSPPLQLKSYLALVESVFGAVHENIESLYHDLFIETCDDWVIPYIGDLLGTSHLAGDPWTLRADVAD